jgi:hypothetical protein
MEENNAQVFTVPSFLKRKEITPPISGSQMSKAGKLSKADSIMLIPLIYDFQNN